MDQYRIKFLPAPSGAPVAGIVKIQRMNGDKPESADGPIPLTAKTDLGKLMQAWGWAMMTDTFLPSLAGSPSLYISLAVEDGTGHLRVQYSEKRTHQLTMNISAFTFRDTTMPEGAIPSTLLN